MMKEREVEPTREFVDDVRIGLTAMPKTLPPIWFYDAIGSKLFEAITEQPEYYLTSTERDILESNAADILALAGVNVHLVELGAGSAAKTRVLLRILLDRQGTAEYDPIDVSADAVVPAAEALTEEFKGLTVRPIVGRNRDAIKSLDPHDPIARLIMYIGSSIGNFEPKQAIGFLCDIATSMRPHDRFLLGADVRKEKAVLEAAYNDAAGITARFNLNLLTRMNRELGADFDLARFKHKAIFNETESRIEMHLVSIGAQTVRIEKAGIDVTFVDGETIHTENSYKYSLDALEKVISAAGLVRETSWFDAEIKFGLHLLRRHDA